MTTEKLEVPILDGRLPTGWKTIIIYLSTKPRVIPHSKFILEKAYVYDRRGFAVCVNGKTAYLLYNEGQSFNQIESRLINTYINNDYLYYNRLGYKVTGEFRRESVLPSLEEIKRDESVLLEVPLIKNIMDKMLDDNEHPRNLQGRKTSAPRRRAPAKKCPIKVDYRRMI